MKEKNKTDMDFGTKDGYLAWTGIYKIWDPFKKSSIIEGYADGIVISIAVYFLSPEGDKLRNVLVIGGLHGLLHDYAAHKLLDYEKESKTR